ncbi:MAG: hypothetical protein JXR73_12595, partial [Candidatus Omnitrophica bacterium]|nr:hypothetical protein [Candidatus Omnitrophota bacterium]
MINFILGFWQFFWVWGFGFLFARRFLRDLPYGYYAAIAFALGEVFLSYFYFALGMIGGLRFWVLVPLAIALTIASFAVWLREAHVLFPAIYSHVRRSPGSAIAAGLILLFYAAACCVPEREVDAIWYHLAVPLYYIQHGGFIQLVPFNMPSHYPMNAHLHYVFSLLAGNDTTAKVFNYCHFFPLLILIAAVVKRYAGGKWSLFAVAVYLCALHFRAPVMVNVQRAVYFYVFLSTVLLWYSLEHNRRRLFMLAAVFCGMAMGTKFNGLLFGFAPQFLFLAYRLIRWKRRHWKHELKWIAVYCLIAWLMMSPWLIKSAFYTGNPLYPMLGEIFPTHPDFIPAMLSNANNHGLNILKSSSIAEFFGQIWNNILWLVFNAYLLFFLGILSVGVMLALKRKRWTYPVICALLAYSFFTLLWGSDIARLFGVNNGLLVVCITCVVSWLTPRLKYGRWLTAVILISLTVTFAKERYYFLRSPNINWLGRIVLSESDRQAWMEERNIFSSNLFELKTWIDQAVPVEDELYGYRTGYLFYLNRKYIVSGAH